MAKTLPLTRESAETLALRALAYVAGAEGALDRLMDQSGLDRESLRQRAGEPEFQSSVLDFLLADEQLLLEFCETAALDPKAVHMARHLLGGP